MKKDAHPTYYPDAKVSCACGNEFTVGSTVKEILIELCSNCHPFYTGKQKLVDTARRVEKFHEKAGKKVATTAVSKKAKEAARKAKKDAK
jgi:large subunit ribosomal protein L31